MSTIALSNTSQTSLSRSDAIRAALVLMFVGATLVFITGFSQIDNLHNAAHDTRHALSFPCH